MQSDALLPARLSPAFAAQTARLLYDVGASARPLPGEYDDNFHLITEDKEHFVLKIMHKSRQLDFIELQCQALQHLARLEPELELPRVRSSVAGKLIETCMDSDGHSRVVWMLSYVPGRALAATRPHTWLLRQQLGEIVGRIDRALASFTHPAAQRPDFKWSLSNAAWVLDDLGCISNPERRCLVESFMARYMLVLPGLSGLRHGVIHGDANDHNLIARSDRGQAPRIVSLVDFGDMHHAATISGLAIACAYALLDVENPLDAIMQTVAGYHGVQPLTEDELAMLFTLIAARLCVSVVNSAKRKALAPDDPYITISEAPAWTALERLAAVPERLAHFALRGACGLPCVPGSAAVVRLLKQQKNFLPVMPHLANAPVLDLGIGSLWTGADPQALQCKELAARIGAVLQTCGARVAIGRYDEVHAPHSGAQFRSIAYGLAGPPTLQLGLDLFCEAGTAVQAPLAGRVHALGDNPKSRDQGPVVILAHESEDAPAFYTLYGHLSHGSVEGLRIGQSIAAGQRFASVGDASVSGGRPPHLHFQLIVDMLDLGVEFPHMGQPALRALWHSLCPDPNLIVGIPEQRFPPLPPTSEQTQAARNALLGRNLSVSYRQPLKMVRGWRQYLFDDQGRAHLDVYNNVPLVGHSHPTVVEAIQRQAALLNTNTRYLHDTIVRYAERLTALLPEPLRVCYFLNSASEANELALRMARAYTRRNDVITLEHAYHGHTSTLIDVSPYKFNGPGGGGQKPWVHVAALADDYRGPYKRDDALAGQKYAAHIGGLIERGARPAAFIAESLPSVGGQIVFPRDYLAEAYRIVREAGAVCIADEVQVGFGRLGAWRWGFESQNVVPDMVVLGKPIGNAFPLAALVTTREISSAFDNGMEFFSTFGGNPVACAAGLAVLDVLHTESLPQNAHRVGSYLKAGLLRMMPQFPLIGDVRGHGLFLGIELVRDASSLEPATEESAYLVNRLRDEGILTGVDGPYHNVIKLRPPLCFTTDDSDQFLMTTQEILGEDAMQS